MIEYFSVMAVVCNVVCSVRKLYCKNTSSGTGQTSLLIVGLESMMKRCP